MFKAA